VLSLDQCFLSDLALNKKKEPRVAELKKLIVEGVQSSKLVCPAHRQEVIFESVLLPESERDLVLGFQNEISGGLAFLPFDEFLGLETLSLVRPTTEIPPYRHHPIKITKSAELKDLADENRAFKKAMCAQANQEPYPPKNYDPSDGFIEISKKISAERSGSMHRITKAILESGTLITGKQEWDFTIGVGQLLLRNRITTLECHNLLDKIEHYEWEMMPVIGIHTLLGAKVEQDMLKMRRRFKVNDHVDILRLAVALQHADALGCDIPMRETMRQAKLDTATKVFSMREIEALSTWIRQGSASQA